jgi:hypothetical protein
VLDTNLDAVVAAMCEVAREQERFDSASETKDLNDSELREHVLREHIWGRQVLSQRERMETTRKEAATLRAELERSRQSEPADLHCVACLSYVYNHHERELAERHGRGSRHQRRVATARAPDRHDGLDERQGEGEHGDADHRVGVSPVGHRPVLVHGPDDYAVGADHAADRGRVGGRPEGWAWFCVQDSCGTERGGG